MGVLDALGTDKVFYYFEEITKIPHGSGNEAALAQYIVDFAKERGLECRRDAADNVVVKKAATPGYEQAPGVIFQGHIDMVCEKLGSVEHDFTKDPLQLEIDGDMIRAKGTTLGADNGIAVAFMLAVLDSTTLEHPFVEAVFTTNEETGMDGAKALDVSDLKGTYFINMDSEEEGEFLVSCCGGRRVQVTLPVEKEAVKAGEEAYVLRIRGLKGGHSGSDINLQRASANKLMGRLLDELQQSGIRSGARRRRQNGQCHLQRSRRCSDHDSRRRKRSRKNRCGNGKSTETGISPHRNGYDDHMGKSK